MAIYKLENVVTLKRGYDLPYHKFIEGEFPVVYSNGILNYHKEYKVNSKYGVVTGRSGTIGNVHFVEGPFWPHNTTLYVENFKGNNPRYIFYLLKSLNLERYKSGTGVPTLNRNHIKDLRVYLPSVSEQEKIIEIIKPIEYLFLKYPSLVRIDTVQNCKNDVGDLIEIIKPIENAEKNLNNQMSVLKEILANQYNSLTTERDYFYRYINIHNDGYSGQKKYFATNAIGEFEVDLNKIQDISLERPSRADLTPQPNSLIFSKLDGENKVLYIPEKFNYVVSTGFFNFTNEFMDHIVGFLLSDDYKKQKTMLSTGTTMVGLNIDGLRQIKLKRPTNNISVLTKHLTLLLQIMNALSARKEQIVSLLIR